MSNTIPGPVAHTVAGASKPGAPQPIAPPAIQLVGISKTFGQVKANHDINITVPRGTIHGIIGENGAGKSTLMSILYGFYRADQGQILIDGQPTAIPDSRAAIQAGIGMVFQHFKLVGNFTVLENIVLGAEDGPLLHRSLSRARAELLRLSRDYGLDVDPDAVVETLSVGHQQRVEILKALYRQARILILDEPTGVLTPAEADHLFRILRGLRDEGKTVILITHKLREIMEATDNVSVMRRGTMVATVATKDTSPEALAELMVGRKVLMRVEKTPAQPGAPLLEIKGLNYKDEHGTQRLKGIDLTLRAGEILGIAGVAGNGQSELLAVLGGMIEPGARASGEIRLQGAPLALHGAGSDARSRRKAGVAHVPEDRHQHAMLLELPAWENHAFGNEDDPRYQGRGPFLNTAAIREDCAARMAEFDVRPPDPMLPGRAFSGGNQQKLVVAREIQREPDLLLIGQPTRGVDVGAIEFIHRQLIALRDKGKAVLLVSVELDEVMSLADRIIVMFDGQIMGEMPADRADERSLGLMMAGVDAAGGAR